MTVNPEHVELVKGTGDAATVSTVAASFYFDLPEWSAVLTFVWLAIRIWETATVQRIVAWVARRAHLPHKPAVMPAEHQDDEGHP